MEFIDLALRLVAAGIGDTYLPERLHARAVLPGGPARRCRSARALYDTFAIVTRPAARLSPGVRELLAELETHMRAVAEEFDRLR